MSIRCRDVIEVMEKLTPNKYAYDWDNVGLLVGNKETKVDKIMVALDATEQVVDEAIEKKVDLIITHHPMIFKGVKRITTDNFIGRKIIKLIQNNICLYAAHTNFDTVGSLSEILANTLGLKDQVVLDIREQEKLFKLVVFVPETHIDQIRDALFSEGAGYIGNYSNCAYSVVGEGTFKPLEGTNPYLGKIGQFEKTKEMRLETIVKEKDLDHVIKAMVKAHPYEEVAYDVYQLKQKGSKIGIGRVGCLDKPLTLEAFAEQVKEKLKIEYIRLYGKKDQTIQKIAVSPGKGVSNIDKAKVIGADVMVTGDIDYHTGVDAIQDGLAVIDAGHFGTEHIMVNYMMDYLKKAFDIEIIKACEEVPFITL